MALLQASCAGSVEPPPVLLSVPEIAPLSLPPVVDLLPTAVPVQTINSGGLIARLNWQGELGERTIVFDTAESTVKLRQAGFGSLVLKLGDTIVYVNPWSEAADYLDKGGGVCIMKASIPPSKYFGK